MIEQLRQSFGTTRRTKARFLKNKKKPAHRKGKKPKQPKGPAEENKNGCSEGKFNPKPKSKQYPTEPEGGERSPNQVLTVTRPDKGFTVTQRNKNRKSVYWQEGLGKGVSIRNTSPSHRLGFKKWFFDEKGSG